MARTSHLRASDADRDAVAERLRSAAVEGRLEPDELEDRLHTALRARTYGELDRLLVDLPRRTPSPRRRPTVSTTSVVLAIAVRVMVVLLVITALAVAMFATALWWLVCLVIWLGLRSRRGCGGFHRPPSARRVWG